MAKAARGLTVSQRKNGSRRAQICKKGYASESRDFLSHAEAEADAWGLGRLAEITATGRLVDRRLAERTTFEAALLAYKEQVTSKRPGASSRSAEEARIGRFIREEKKLCSYALAHISTEMLEAWRDRRLTETVSRGVLGGRGQYKAEVVPNGRLKKDGTPRANAAKPKAAAKPTTTVSPSTVRREMTLLKRVFDFAMRRYMLAQNPMNRDLIDRPPAQDERDVRLTVAECEGLLDSCRASKNTLLAPFVEVALEVGSRRGSLSRLLWKDVNLDGLSVTFRGVKNSRAPSENRDIEVGLSTRAIEVLRSLPTTDARVFPTSIEALSSAFDRARERIGLGHFRMHDVRHQAATRLVEAGWGILDVMAQLDWRDMKSAKRYYSARGAHLGSKLAILVPTTNASTVERLPDDTPEATRDAPIGRVGEGAPSIATSGPGSLRASARDRKGETTGGKSLSRAPGTARQAEVRQADTGPSPAHTTPGGRAKARPGGRQFDAPPRQGAPVDNHP